MYDIIQQPLIKTLNANTEGRDFVVGDIHGCYDELMILLRAIKFNPLYDRVICTGDLIDRGTKSKECVELLQEPWFFSVFGNHEEIFRQREDGFVSSDKTKNDLISEEEFKSILPCSQLIRKMPLIYQVKHMLHGAYYVVHAEILGEALIETGVVKINSNYTDEAKSLNKKMIKTDLSIYYDIFFGLLSNQSVRISPNKMESLIWARRYISNYYNEVNTAVANREILSYNPHFENKTKIFCGHNIVPCPIKIGQQYYLDTGASLGYSTPKTRDNFFKSFQKGYFSLSIVDVGDGLCYSCLTSPEVRGKILINKKPLFSVDF